MLTNKQYIKKHRSLKTVRTLPRRIKVLQLESWMKSPENEICEMDYFRTGAVVNRDGQYYDRYFKWWWFEHDGKAYCGTNTSAVKQFLYTLSFYNYRPLTTVEISHTKAVLGVNTNPQLKKILKRQLHDHVEWKTIQSIRQESAKARTYWRKEWSKENGKRCPRSAVSDQD